MAVRKRSVLNCITSRIRRAEQSNEPLVMYANTGQWPVWPGADGSRLIKQKGRRKQTIRFRNAGLNRSTKTNCIIIYNLYMRLRAMPKLLREKSGLNGITFQFILTHSTIFRSMSSGLRSAPWIWLHLFSATKEMQTSTSLHLSLFPLCLSPFSSRPTPSFPCPPLLLISHLNQVGV